MLGYLTQTLGEPEVAPELLGYPPSQVEEIDATEKQEFLLKALGRLEEEELLLYQLSFRDELAASEIATRLRTEVKDIYKRKQKLALKLKRLIQELQCYRKIKAQ